MHTDKPKEDVNEPPAWLHSDVDRYFDPAHRGWCFPAWVYIHAVADSFPENPSPEARRLIEAHFQSFAKTLPCSICSAHFQELMAKNPMDSSSGDNLSKWVVWAHNEVNKRTHSPVLPFEDAMAAQDWNRSIRWSKVVEDLKSCSQLSASAMARAGARSPGHTAFFRSRKSSDEMTGLVLHNQVDAMHKAAAAPPAQKTMNAPPAAVARSSSSSSISALLLLLAAVAALMLLVCVLQRKPESSSSRPSLPLSSSSIRAEPSESSSSVGAWQRL